jgi:small GTP-binding protein
MKQQGFIFICHDPKDKKLRDEIASMLEENGYTVWNEGIKISPGTDWSQEIEKPIRNSESVIILITRKSQDSEWVNRQITYSVSLPKYIFPLIFEDARIPDLLMRFNVLRLQKPINKSESKILLQALRSPFEVFSKSEEGFNRYREDLAKGNQLPIHEIKLNIVGQGSVGKTSILRRLLENKFSVKEAKTEGISVSKWSIDNTKPLKNDIENININLWDFGGQEIMHATHQFFLTKRSLYLLVLDSRLTQEENRVEYWLKIIQSFGGESPVLIVGNKIDQHPLDIDRTGLQKKYPNIVGILETSAATGAGIEALKTAITEQVNNLPHVRDLLPETWFTVKTKLEELGRQSNFINHDDYVKLCAENEVSDETSQHTLIGFLHDLGVVLHFQDDPRLEALGILNPQWVTNGVYKILNSYALFQNKGVLTSPCSTRFSTCPNIHAANVSSSWI